jgi:DNA-binding transcriptional regulator YiaG
MTPAELRRIRAKAGLSLDGLAKVLRIADLSTIHRWEKGDRAISGPASILLEMLDQGELPDRYLTRK